jgi:DNA processing protein
MVCSQAARLWLGIISAKGIGPQKWADLARSMPLEEIARMLDGEAGRERLSRMLGRAVGPPDAAFVENQLRLLDAGGLSLVSISDECYPELLRQIYDPPLVLFCGGDARALSRPSLCIVGSRRATRRGLMTAACLARELSERGIQVVSGLARGIDGASHRGALAAGGDDCVFCRPATAAGGGEAGSPGPLEQCGGTSAVLGCGVDAIYPPEHAGLAKEMTETGCIVSEFPLGTPPLKHHFPQRNRILSGLSLGVVVVEADIDSGAMGTARWAVEQNREVFAVPGPIDHPGSRGPHKLIREGATLIENVGDILAELPQLSARRHECATRDGEDGPHESRTASLAHRALRGPFTDEERAVLSALDLNPKHIDELVQFCHISPTFMLPILLGLEMRGVIESCGGGTYALAATQ